VNDSSHAVERIESIFDVIAHEHRKIASLRRG
jgi:hypothetical protein